MSVGVARTDWNSRGSGLQQMIQYAILGTSHSAQDSPQFENSVIEAIQKHQIMLVAEEYPCDNASRVCVTAKRSHIPYLQVDLYPDEWPAHGIDCEMKMRSQAVCLQEQDVRLSHADTVRENFWLKEIENCLEQGRVLIICGYLHLDFLADNIRERGSKVLDKNAFPADLLGRKPTKIFSPIELKEHLRVHGESAGP
jgi:hypothetical protein